MYDFFVLSLLCDHKAPDVYLVVTAVQKREHEPVSVHIDRSYPSDKTRSLASKSRVLVLCSKTARRVI